MGRQSKKLHPPEWNCVQHKSLCYSCFIRNLPDALTQSRKKEPPDEMPFLEKLPCQPVVLEITNSIVDENVILKNEIRPQSVSRQLVRIIVPRKLDMSWNPLNCGSITLSQL
ncbi:uncharacterized protein LOC129741716 [Uranotaenia lowii]|uniref:uncharacterized protein LOC129741716 n=1 Tax=Uranotaenia lowii TaxID=190385 RepID=UPI00247A9898|nr:uncharacterized protein LOC129741716 [Uranotaenia lowii]